MSRCLMATTGMATPSYLTKTTTEMRRENTTKKRRKSCKASSRGSTTKPEEDLRRESLISKILKVWDLFKTQTTMVKKEKKTSKKRKTHLKTLRLPSTRNKKLTDK